MSELAREQDALLRALARHGVELVVVGGVAAQLHGWRGATVDLDIAVSIEQGNVERLNAALADIGAGPGVPGALGTVFSTVYGRLEIVRRADGIGDYVAWLRRARPRDIGDGLAVVVADPDDILRSKEAAGRDKDRAALPQMRRDFIEAGALAPDAARGPVAAARAAASGPPAFLTSVLGERPAEPSAARLWDGAAQLVLDYRARWGITDPLAALEPNAPRAARRRTVHSSTRPSHARAACCRDEREVGSRDRSPRPTVELGGRCSVHAEAEAADEPEVEQVSA